MTLSPGLIQSQKIIFCDWVRPEGKPMHSYSMAEIERFGRFINILYESDSLLPQQKLYYTIDRQQDGKWIAEDVVRFEPELGLKSAWHLYHFRKPGTFRVSALSETLDTLATESLDLILPDFELGTQYYAGIDITFAEGFEDGEPVNSKDTFNLPHTEEKDNKLEFRVIADLGMRLSIETLIVDVWKKTDTGYDAYKGEFEFKINPDWDYTQFKFHLDAVGDYRLMLYTGGSIFMGMRDLTVLGTNLQ